MKTKIFASAVMIAVLSTGFAAQVVDRYELKMTLKMPQVIDNMSSKGYRQYETDTLTGTLQLKWEDGKKDREPTITFGSLKNEDYKVSTGNVTYTLKTVSTKPIRDSFVLVGNNKTGVFETPAMALTLECTPNYAKTESGTDNSLYLTLAGIGELETLASGDKALKSISGSVVGAMGCACKDYGHVSPTRGLGSKGASGDVVDAAPIVGVFTLTRTAGSTKRD